MTWEPAKDLLEVVTPRTNTALISPAEHLCDGPPDLTAAEFKAWTRNAWHISAGHADQCLGHPAMFPLELARRLIKLYSFPGDVVLDPFMGSGTTLQAARLLGRTGLGVETWTNYCRLAAGRICQQPLLFEFS